MISSFFPGRIRLRAPVFKDAELVEQAQAILRTFPALTKVEHNPVTGSVLIEYESDKVPMETLLPMKDFFMRLADEAQRYDGTNREKISAMLDELRSLHARLTES